ncbi:hypothetical protein K1T71_000510 [Dendrolimus kikuchii]|uniref:Uncharacterized protein n=1 Tax=Dendrolimus kikuchii TaxID=765133 RepID=A0ACC1DKQ1_9NEOP|nr:hypothetical protein K1T71_000510 [Dendrolimus kikuchii]
MRLKQKVERKRPELINRRGVVFHHDNARPHTSLVTQQKSREFGWEVLMHPSYSPDLAPSDFHLFRSLQNFLGSVRLTSREDCQNHLKHYVLEFLSYPYCRKRLKCYKNITLINKQMTNFENRIICF